MRPLARALGLNGRPASLSFEQKYPTAIGGRAPNLDVVLTGQTGELLAIESKFTEPYVRSKKKSYLRDKYFPPSGGVWSDAGLSGCQELADGLRTGSVSFQFLDAAQLLKHMLGLSESGHSWLLLCLWYEASDDIARVHSAEIEAFMEGIGIDRIRFAARTYQHLFRALVQELGGRHAEYEGYLRARYFPRQIVMTAGSDGS
jgi:hypothetical protein